MVRILSALACRSACSLVLRRRARRPRRGGIAAATIIADYERFERQCDPVTAGRKAIARRCAACPMRRPQAEQAHRKAARGDRRAPRRRSMRVSCRGEAALNHDLLTRIVKEAIEEAGVRLRSHRVPERQRLPHARRLSRRARRPSRRARMPMRGSRGWKRCRRSTSRTSRTCSAASRRATRSRASSSIACCDVARKQAEAKPEDSSLLLPFARMPASIPAAAQAEYRSKALAIVRDTHSVRRSARSPSSWRRTTCPRRGRRSPGARRRTARPAIASWCAAKPRRT